MDPPAQGHLPLFLPTFSFSSWDHEVYVVETTPPGDGYLEVENERLLEFISVRVHVHSTNPLSS